jgi:hypothetical protein
VTSKMLLKCCKSSDCLMLFGDMTGPRSRGEPCVTAATDSMVDRLTWVYLPLADAVAEIIESRDDVAVGEMADRIREAVDRGIAAGAEARGGHGRDYL